MPANPSLTRRKLTEPEFNAVRDKVLAALPKGLSETEFNQLVPSMMEQALTEAEYAPAPVEGSAVGRFVGGAAEMLNPIALVQGAYQAVRHPIDTTNSLMAASDEQGELAKQAFNEGRFIESVGHTVGRVPLIGPAAVGAGQRIASGDVAGGLGQSFGLLAPAAAPTVIRRAMSGGRRVLPPGARATTAASLEQRAANQVAEVMTPQVGPNKLRFAAKAQKVAPELAKRLVDEPAPLTREGFHAQIGERLANAETMLDEAADARLAARSFDTQPILDDLMKKRQVLVAEPVEGSRLIPSIESGVQRGIGVDPGRNYALQWMLDEMNTFPFNKRTFNEIPVGKGGDLEVVPGSAGASIYREIVGPEGSQRINATRAQVAKAIGEVFNGNTEGKLRQYVVEVADKLAMGDRTTQKAMWTPGPIPNPEIYDTVRWRDITGKKPAPPLQVSGRPIGQRVEPGPNADKIAVIDKAIEEIKALGPVVRYDSIKTIRQAYDKPAKIKYNPSLTQDFLKVQGSAEGAADVTGVLRQHMAKMDPQTAVANAEYTLYRSADDVLTALDDIERTRPKVGRRLMTRLTGVLLGGQAGGTVGAIGGAILGPAIEATTLTTKLQRAKLYSQLAQAIRRGDEGHVASLSQQIKRLGAQAATLQGRSTSPSEPQTMPTGLDPAVAFPR